MREQLTEKAQKVLSAASKAAHAAGFAQVDADYALLALGSDTETMAQYLLDEKDLSLEEFAALLSSVRPVDSTDAVSTTDTFVNAVYDEARNRDHKYVGTEHLLLAIAASDSQAGRFLSDSGIDYASLLDTIESGHAGIEPPE